MAGRKKKSPPAPGNDHLSRPKGDEAYSKKHERKNSNINKQSKPVFSEKSVPVAAGRKDNSKDSVTIILDPVITLAEVSRMKESLLGYIGAQQIVIDVSNVEQIDTAGLQLLIAFTKALKKQGGKIIWIGESAAYSSTADLLNLTAALGQEEK